jgi:hypothetical protein
VTDIETTAEGARAQYHYPPIRTALLPSPADELQMRLADRLSHTAHQHALQVIANLGRVFDAEDAVVAVESLGRLLVTASLLAGVERMAIAPIIALGREWTRDSGVSSELPLKPASVLAQAVLDSRREPAAIVRGLAMAIAKALDDCEIVHELKIDPLELFKVAAREVLDGKPVTAVTAPAVQPTQPDKAAQRALAWTELRKASEAVVAGERAFPGHDYDAPCPCPPNGACPCGCHMTDEEWQRHREGFKWDPDGGRPVNPDVGAAAAMYDPPDLYDRKASGPIFGLGEFIPQTGTIEIPTELPPIAVAPACPVCHVPMSPRADMPWAWACKDHP